MNIYIPYTYLIGWSQHNKWYYGVRYSKKCNPEDLWKTYFTSSKKVQEFRKQYGDPDIIQVRKIFDNPIKAKSWEDRVLMKLKVESSEKWLNVRSNTWKNVIFTDEMCQKISESAKGNTRTKGYTNEYRLKNGFKLITGKPRGIKEKQETRDKKSQARKGKCTVKDLDGNCFLLSCDDERIKLKTVLSVMKGVRTGIPLKCEIKRKISISRKGIAPVNKGTKSNRCCCVVCGKEVDIGNLGRHHRHLPKN